MYITHVLAQIAEPSPKQVEAAKEALKDLLSGIPRAAESQPVQYLNVIVIVALMILFAFVSWKWFAHQARKEAIEAAEREKRTVADEAQRQHLQRLAESFSENQRVAAQDCHLHSLKMIDKQNDGAVRIAEASSNLQMITTDLKGVVHDFRNIAQENKGLIETILFDKAQKPPAVVNQVINPVQKRVEDE